MSCGNEANGQMEDEDGGIKTIRMTFEGRIMETKELD